MGFPGRLSGEDSNPASAGDAGLIPGLGGSLGEERAAHSSILAWEVAWTEEPGGLQSTGSQSHMTDHAGTASVRGGH